MVDVVAASTTTSRKTKKFSRKRKTTTLSIDTLLKIFVVTLLSSVSIWTILLAFHDDVLLLDVHQIPSSSSSPNHNPKYGVMPHHKHGHQLHEQQVVEPGSHHYRRSMERAVVGLQQQINDPYIDPCKIEYERVMSSTITQGLTEEDLLRSRAWIGNEERLVKFVNKLTKKSITTATTTTNESSGGNGGGVNVVVCGGSITLGHGVEPAITSRYSNKLEDWLNQMYPLSSSSSSSLPHPRNQKGQQQPQPKHNVYNHGSHGADMCAMAKRMDMVFNSKRLGIEDDPDMIILEFAVNDYQGQDHKVHLDHKTDIFFDGFQTKALCTEAVVYKLLQKYPNTAIVFLEFQTAILNRKTAQLLHMGVAQHYQIPVVSYAETMMPGYYYLIDQLKDYDYSAPIGDEVAPYPHGCAPCQLEHITSQFRHGGCKSICTFVQRSGLISQNVNCTHPRSYDGKKRVPCMPPFWAHDAVHPSFVGHDIARDLIANAIALTKQKLCMHQQISKHVLPPKSINFLGSNTQLEAMTDWVMVQDTMDVFGERDPLVSKNHSKGFQLFGDQFAERLGWICNEKEGGHYIEFDIDLPVGGCYVIYIASLKSYEGMGNYSVRMIDLQHPSENSYEMDVNGTWEPRISVPADIAIQPSPEELSFQNRKNSSNRQGMCTGKCKVTVTTHPSKRNQKKGNKVKIMTLSARECVEGEFSNK